MKTRSVIHAFAAAAAGVGAGLGRIAGSDRVVLETLQGAMVASIGDRHAAPAAEAAAADVVLPLAATMVGRQAASLLARVAPGPVAAALAAAAVTEAVGLAAEAWFRRRASPGEAGEPDAAEAEWHEVGGGEAPAGGVA